MSRQYLYPLWLRIWHGFNALLFLVLILSGLSLHYTSTLLPFETAMLAHNAAGVLLSLNYLAFVVGNLASGNARHYLPRMRRFLVRQRIQIRYYLGGIFRGRPHPFHTDSQAKFNPLQQVTYLGIMYLLMPGIVVTGLFLLFPDTAPDTVLGQGGVWVMATLHTILGFFLSAFMIGHLYLATTGKTPTSNFRGMVTGWHED